MIELQKAIDAATTNLPPLLEPPFDSRKALKRALEPLLSARNYRLPRLASNRNKSDLVGKIAWEVSGKLNPLDEFRSVQEASENAVNDSVIVDSARIFKDGTLSRRNT